MINDPYNHYFTPTGLYTSTVFSILLDHEVARTKRYPSPLSILYLSVCQPEPLTGKISSSIEQTISQLIKSKLRQTDISSQYKDDFLILLTNTDASGATIAAHRLIDSLNSLLTPQLDKPFDTACCAGLASHPGGASTSADMLLKQATLAHQEARIKGPGSLVIFQI